MISSATRQRIARSLRAQPLQRDRQLARHFGAAPGTVAAIRAELGLPKMPRGRPRTSSRPRIVRSLQAQPPPPGPPGGTGGLPDSEDVIRDIELRDLEDAERFDPVWIEIRVEFPVPSRQTRKLGDNDYLRESEGAVYITQAGFPAEVRERGPEGLRAALSKAAGKAFHDVGLLADWQRIPPA